MSLSDDEQDDNIFDRLKSIKAFTVDQLYLLHPDVGCPASRSDLSTGSPNNQSSSTTSGDAYHDANLYQNLVEYEQFRHKLAKLASQVKLLHKRTFDHVEKIWVFNVESQRKIGMCAQGKIAETTFNYKQAFINQKQINALEASFSELSATISRDYIYYSFESQMKRHKIAAQLAISYQIPDIEKRMPELKSSIVTLIGFLKHLSDSKSDFVSQCHKWLRALIKRLLEQETTDNYRFVIAQLCRGPAGTGDWCADLIECKPFEQVRAEFESTPQYITHCSALLYELFANLKSRIRRVTISLASNQTESNLSECSEQSWSLIDPRFSCSEELNISSPNSTGNTLSESDVIKLCLKIPVAQIFRAYVKKCLESDELEENDKNYEYVMLKLITIGTIIIKTYQGGLETFNSIQFGSLIEYLSSQIRRTVIVLSDQWSEFKRRLKGIDNALLMRLQVEYDNFILRSILIISELRQSGIWRHLSRTEPECSEEIVITGSGDSAFSWSTEGLRPAFAKLLQATGLTSSTAQSTSQPIELDANNQRSLASKSSSSQSLTYGFSIEWFKEVSEPMLWHILWQFYHKAFVNSCDYHSVNYWLEKFRKKSVVYLFVNKMRDSPPGECSYLLNSITSMLISRTRHDSKFVGFVATEIFNLSFKQEQALRDKIVKKGIKSLIQSAEKFPNLISLFISYIVNEEVPDDVVELFKGCSLAGWICNDDEIGIMASWLIEYPLTSVHNKVSRLLISKLMLNSPEFRLAEIDEGNDSMNQSQYSTKEQTVKSKKANKSQHHCFVDLRVRRRFALLLYEASVHHVPENNDLGSQSLGASVEVAFGGFFCGKSPILQNNLIELATDTSYQQLYIWIWRLLFTFRLHILNQLETDWNDVQSRSGTSRSIKNTVLLNDSFHPVPSIQDSECLSLSEGVKRQNPVALFIYLLMTDATWRTDILDSCLNHLNAMAVSGHLTPSMTAMDFLIICHLNDLTSTMAKDQRCVEYFSTIITSNFDSTRIASLIISQMLHLKQYRQLQLSQFYVTILFEVASAIVKQLSSSWFSGESEYSLEKVACILDYIVKFNFSTQRLEIIRKFYECSYSVQACKSNSGWFGSFFTSNYSLSANSTKREFLTILHVLTQKFKKYTWLRWITTECDTLRLEKLWEDIVVYLSTNEAATLDSAIKKVCPQVNPSILKSTLPIYSWLTQIFDIVETDLNHPLCPLIWYNFFLNYFANSLNTVSVGLKLIQPDTQTRLMTRLDSLFNYHLYKHRNWSSTSPTQQNSLAQLYRAYRLWIQDASLQDAYVDLTRLKDDYLVPLLKSVLECSTEGVCLQYIDLQSIETQNRNLSQVWSVAMHLDGNNQMKELVFVDSKHDESMEILTRVDDEASDAATLASGTTKSPARHSADTSGEKLALSGGEEELRMPVIHLNEQVSNFENSDVNTEMKVVKKNFQTVFEESSIFGSNMKALERTKSDIVDFTQQLYTNKKRELVRTVACADGHECPGPARIKLEVEEATKDDRKSECVLDRQRQFDEILADLLAMPSHQTVHATILIEDHVKQFMLIKEGKTEEDKVSSIKLVIESLLSWISEPRNYSQLNGDYHVANHLLKTVLDILSTTHDEVDTFNIALIEVCFKHPGSVQIFSPHLSPVSCSSECFLILYKRVSGKQSELGPMAMFVLLSKFDINTWLKSIKSREMHQDVIRTTCSGLKQMGKQPDDCFALTFDLYKRHIQVELAPPDRRRPEEIALVLREFLAIMHEQSLAPQLWDDFMTILGLEKQLTPSLFVVASRGIARSNQQQVTPELSSSLLQHDDVSVAASTSIQQQREESTLYASIIEDITRFADGQVIFNYQTISDLVDILIEFVHEKYATSDVTLLELYQDYLDQFSVVLLSITFVWLGAMGEQYPDNHELIWKKFMSLWYHWVFLSKNCQQVSKNNYSLIATHYVAALRFMILKIPDNARLVLQSVLKSLADYVGSTKEVVYLELTILQRSLMHLNWSSLLASPEDFENLAILSEQVNYNLSDLVSHILIQLNIKESLSKIYEFRPETVVRVAERLSTTIVLQSTHLKGFRLNGVFFFTQVPVASASRLAELILPRMEFANLEHSQSNKLLVNLLRMVCIKLESVNEFQNGNISQQSQQNRGAMQQPYTDDTYDRSIVYAKFVSNYLINLIKNHPQVIRFHKDYLYAVIDNTLQDLKLLLSADVPIGKKVTIYSNLLECCSNGSIVEDARLLMAKSLLKSELLNSRPIVAMEMFHSIGQIISDGRVLVYTLERMISIYLNMSGHYEKVWKSFTLSILPSDLYLSACIEENAPLALLVYFEALCRNGQDNQQISDNEPNARGTSSGSVLSEHPPMALNNNKIWSSFFHWISQLNIVTYVNGNNELKSNDTRLVITWLRLIDMLESTLYQFIHCCPYTTYNSQQPGDNVSVTGEGVGSTPCEQGNNSDRSSLASSAAGEQASGAEVSPQQQSQGSLNHQTGSSPALANHHKALIDFLKRLISMYDTYNSGGLWSYLRSTRTDQGSRVSIVGLAVACFLSDRTLTCLYSETGGELEQQQQRQAADGNDGAVRSKQQQSPLQSRTATQVPSHLVPLRDEVAKLRKVCLGKLETARKSKYYLENAQFIESLIESVNRNDKVQYSEGVQLITTFVKLIYAAASPKDIACIEKILVQ